MNTDTMSDTLDYVELASDIQEATLAMDTAYTAYANITKIADTINDSLDKGGCTTSECRLMESSINSLLRDSDIDVVSLGLDSTVTTGSAGMMIQTVAALDTIGLIITQIWDLIVLNVKRVLEFVRKLWVKHVSIVGQLHKSVIALLKRAHDTNDNDFKDIIDLRGHLVTNLTTDGIWNSKKVTEGIAKVRELLTSSDSSSPFAVTVGLLSDIVDKATKSIKSDDVITGTSSKLINNDMTDLLSKVNSAIKSIIGDNGTDEVTGDTMTTRYSTAILGGRHINVTVNVKMIEGQTVLTRAKVYLTSEDIDTNDTDMTIPGLGKTVILEMLNELELMTGAMVNLKLDPDRNAKVIDKLSKKASKLVTINAKVSADNGTNDTLTANTVTGLIRLTGTYASLINEPALSMSTYGTQLAGNIVRLVKLNLK